MGIQMDSTEEIAVMPVRFGWMLASRTKMLMALCQPSRRAEPKAQRLASGRYTVPQPKAGRSQTLPRDQHGRS